MNVYANTATGRSEYVDAEQINQNILSRNALYNLICCPLTFVTAWELIAFIASTDAECLGFDSFLILHSSSARLFFITISRGACS